MNNDRINNAQRKALVGIVDDVMERKIQEAKDASGELIADITESVKAELGIDTFDNQIKAFESQIATLQDKKEQLGFSKHNNLMDGSKAKALIDNRLNESSTPVRSLEVERAKIISSVWTASSLSEVKELVESVLN